MSLERRIKHVSAEINRYSSMYERTTDALMKGHYRDEVRRLNAELAKLICQRSPEAVRRLEAERGLA